MKQFSNKIDVKTLMGTLERAKVTKTNGDGFAQGFIAHVSAWAAASPEEYMTLETWRELLVACDPSLVDLTDEEATTVWRAYDKFMMIAPASLST